MQIDRDRAREAFARYVEPYDPHDPKIALKYDHTLRVAELCDRIARASGLPAEDADVAWLLGLLHDIGRFEQVRRYGTFSDAKSVSHAALGVDVLFGPGGDAADKKAGRTGAGGTTPETARTAAADAHAAHGRLDAFVPDATDEERALVRTAVATHSAWRLPTGLDARTRALCDVLRDADKVDILKANTLTPTQDILDVPEAQIRASTLSPAARDAFLAHRTMRREERSTPADCLVSYACFVFELVYPESVRVAREQGHALEVLGRPYDRADTRAEMARLAAHLRAWMDERIASGAVLEVR